MNDRNGYSVGVEIQVDGNIHVHIYRDPRIESNGSVVFISTLDRTDWFLLSSVRNIYRLD